MESPGNRLVPSSCTSICPQSESLSPDGDTHCGRQLAMKRGSHGSDSASPNNKQAPSAFLCKSATRAHLLLFVMVNTDIRAMLMIGEFLWNIRAERNA